MTQRPELWTLSATTIAQLLAAGEVSSEEVTRAHLGRIEELDRTVRAFTTVFREDALQAARKSDEERRRGETRGLLHGLPVSIKESLDLAGLPTTLGVPSRRSSIGQED